MNTSALNTVAYLTSGAGGMYCGSCLHDNTLARALIDAGCHTLLIPTYTPIRTDEPDMTVDQVFFGGINVYLQQKIPLLRYVPAFLDRYLDNPRLIRRVTRRTIEMPTDSLGKLAVSMLKGLDGNQRKEVRRLERFLEQTARPDLLVFSNILIGGCIPFLANQLSVPIIVTLQGDDIFLESLSSKHKSEAIREIQRIAESVDAFIVHSEFYRHAMVEYLGLDSEKFHVTRLGLDVQQFAEIGARPPATAAEPAARTIGYLARIAPEKGLHILVDAFIELKQQPATEDVKLKIAGWLGGAHQDYANEQFAKLDRAGLVDSYEFLGTIDRQQKIALLDSIDLLSVPTVYRDPKGLFALEALAAGVPVVQPDHGAFPEMMRETGGGVLVPPDDAGALAAALGRLIADPVECRRLGAAGRRAVHARRSAQQIARETIEVFHHVLNRY